ncbi:MAG: PD40 domain-containing protein [Gemmatimonadaceae bacterium]|nr:PD40 domain-containing protein [Gemmatimonadaceae bacterium]
MRARLLSIGALGLLPLCAAAQGPNPVNLWLVDVRWNGNRLALGEPVKLTKDNGASQPAFSPDGRSVVFSAQRDTGAQAQSDIYRIDLATGLETRVTSTPENENSPTINARGEYVAVRWRPATLFREFGPWVYSSDGVPARGVLRGPDTTGYYTPLANGDYALTRPKSASFTIGLFSASTGTIVDVDSGVPALPPQLVPGARALSYVRIDTATARHELRRVDLATRRTSSLGPTVPGRTVHIWLPQNETIVMGKGNAIYARAVGDREWRLVARFANLELRNISAYAVSPRGDQIVLTSPRRLALATVIRDSLEAGMAGVDAVAIASAMRAAADPGSLDVTEGSLIAVADERLQRKRAADASAVLAFVTTIFPESWRAFERLGDAHRAQGARDAAQAAYRRALEVNPRSTDAQRSAAESVQRKLAGQP